MKKIMLMLLLILLLIGCTETNEEDQTDNEEDIVEVLTAENINHDLKKYVDNTLSFDHKYVITSSKRNEFNPHGIINYTIVSNPGQKLSFISTTRGDVGPGSIRLAAYDGKYYEIIYKEGIGEVIEEVESFTPDNIVVDLGPSLTYHDVFSLLSEDNIKSFDVKEELGVLTYTLELKNHDVLDQVGEGSVTFLETVPNSAILDRRLVVTVKDEKILTWDYSAEVEHEGTVDTIDAHVIIKNNVEEYIEGQIEEYPMFGRKLPWFLENYSE